MKNKYSEEEIKRAQHRVECLSKVLRIKLRQHMPYYGYIITKLSDIIFTDQISTAATDGLNILVNPSFMINKSDSEINFILLHEILHVVFLHRVRFEKNKSLLDHELYNEACDYVINYELYSQQNNFKSATIDITLPERALIMRDESGEVKDISKYSAEEIYKMLSNDKNRTPSSNQGNSGSSQSGSQGNPEPSQSGSQGNPMSDDVVCNIPSNAKTASISSIERSVKQALADIARKGYSLDGTGLGREIELNLAATKIRWDKYLRRFLSSKITDGNSYDTPNRKYLPYDLIIPGPGGRDDCITDVFIFIDTSGSINNEDLQKALNNAYTISHEYRATISLAFWDTEVSNVICDIEPDEIRERIRELEVTTGGTDFNCVLNYISDKKLKSAAFIVFTDGCFEIPEISKRIKSKMIIALEDAIHYDKKLNSLGKIVSFS